MADTKEEKQKAEVVAPTLEEAEDALPDMDDAEQQMKLMVQQTFGMMGISQISQENEIAKKIGPEHITEYLAGARENMQNTFKERHESKIFTALLVALALVFFVVIIILLRENSDLLEKIIYSVGGLIAGAFGGYGFGRHKKGNDD